MMSPQQIDAMIGLVRGGFGGTDVRLPRHHALWLLQIAEAVQRLRALTDAHSAGAINDQSYWSQTQVIKMDLDGLFKPRRVAEEPQQGSLLEVEP